MQIQECQTMKNRFDAAMSHVDHAMNHIDHIDHEELNEFGKEDLKERLKGVHCRLKKAKERAADERVQTVSFKTFNSVIAEKPIKNIRSLDCKDIGKCYSAAANDEKARPEEKEVYSLLGKLTGYLRLGYCTHVGNPFVTACGMNGKAEKLFRELKKEQLKILNQILPSIRNPSLKSRLADIVYFGDKRNVESAEIAVRSYCETVNLVVDKKSYFSKDDWENGYQICKLLQRSCTICTEIGWDCGRELRELVKRVYKNAYETREFYDFERLARISLDFSILPPRKVLGEAKRFLEELEDGLLWDFKNLCEDARDKHEEEECKKRGFKDADKNAGCPYGSEEYPPDLGH